MAHEIDMSNGRANVMVAGEPAWHKLGAVVADAPTSAEAMKLAGLDWHVEQWPLRAYDQETDKSIHVPNQTALVRSDTHSVLSVMTEAYVPLQNADAFGFMDQLVAEGQVRYESAGALKGGRVVWMMARIPTEIRVGKGDLQLPYVLLSNSHDGSQAIRIHPTAVRVVCNNTLRLAGRNHGADAGINIMHVGNVMAKVDDARQALGLVAEQFQQYGEAANALAGRQLRLGEFRDFAAGLFPVEDGAGDRTRKLMTDRRDRLAHLFEDEPANNLPGIGGTAWAALNAATHFVDHELRAHGKTEGEKTEGRLRSSWFGRGHKLKQQAYQQALALLN